MSNENGQALQEPIPSSPQTQTNMLLSIIGSMRIAELQYQEFINRQSAEIARLKKELEKYDNVNEPHPTP